MGIFSFFQLPLVAKVLSNFGIPICLWQIARSPALSTSLLADIYGLDHNALPLYFSLDIIEVIDIKAYIFYHSAQARIYCRTFYVQ